MSSFWRSGFNGTIVKWSGAATLRPSLELALTGTDRFDLDCVDLSVFSEPMDEVLGRAFFAIAGEDAILERLLSLGDEYRPLLRRIEIRFLSAGPSQF
jgi:hypothetical protein